MPMEKTPNRTERRAFRKLAPEAQIKQLRGTRVERVFQVERESGIDAEKRTAWLSIASDEPYERWWGIEVLDMASKSIRTERLESGAPLLVGHDTADQVGVVEKHEISPDKKLRILARFGKSARAEEIWQDVLDGIRRNASVGYLIHELVLEKQEKDTSTYRITDWEPLEGSLVPVPADPTVGVGRDLDDPTSPAPHTPTEKDNEMTPEEIKAAEQKAAAEAVKREQDRVAGIFSAGDEYKDHGGVEIARELARDPNATVDTLKNKVLEKMRDKQRPTTTAEPGGLPDHGSGARHIVRRGGALHAFTKPIMFSDGSKMEPEEAAYRSGQWLLATIGGVSRAQKWCQQRGINVEQRVMTTDSGSVGGYLVPDEMEQSIIDLRASYGVARRLARRRPMASDTKSIPKRASGVTAYFVNEDNSGVTASDKGWANVNLVAKTLAALSLLSKNLEEDSIIDVVDDLAMEQAYAFATKEDQCWLIGDGTSTYGGMQGLLTMFDANSYASAFTAASGHDTFVEYDVADITGVMASVADFPGLNPVWLCSKTFAENVFGRLKRVAGAVDNGVERRFAYGFAGYPTETSDVMPKVGTSAVTTTECLFGDFSKSSSFGDRRGIVVEVLRERYAEKLQIGVLSHERFQIVNHDLGDSTNKGPVAALKGQ